MQPTRIPRDIQGRSLTPHQGSQCLPSIAGAGKSGTRFDSMATLLQQNGTGASQLLSQEKTRPSNSCKSFIWILFFVFPFLICYRKLRLRQLWQIQLLWKLFISQAMRNYQRTSTSMYIGHFSLTTESLVLWAEILYWGFSILGAGLVRISAPSDQKNGGPPSLQMTICKGTEEAESSRWLSTTIHAPPFPWFWSSGEPSSLQMTICNGIEELLLRGTID